MKLTTWNCAGGFAKKQSAIFADDGPDIAVIQECSKESTEISLPDRYSAMWVGDDLNKGIGVFFKTNRWNVRRLEDTTHDIRWIVPFQVTGPESFTLIAVWTHEAKGTTYVGELRKAVEGHSEWFQRYPVIVAGDFNSNAIFNKKRSKWNHSTMVAALRRHKLSSAYHGATREEHGQEKTPTFHLYGKLERPFHFDYIFVPDDWQDTRQMTVSVDYQWPPLSDHRPVTLRLTPLVKLKKKIK